MQKVTELIDFLRQPMTGKVLMTFAMSAGVFLLVCYLFGSLGLWRMGRRRRVRPYGFAFLPGVQIYYLMRIAGMKRAARRVEQLLWWWLAGSLSFVAAVIWLAAGLAGAYDGRTLLFLKLLTLFCFLLVAGLYLWIRVLEFCALYRLLGKNRSYWILSLAGTVIGIPLQGLFLFVMRDQIPRGGNEI